MQRWLFFFSCLSLVNILHGQKLQQTEISYWFCEEAPSCSEIEATVIFSFAEPFTGDLTLAASEQLNIEEVRVLEGRLKNSLPFSHSNGALRINDLQLKLPASKLFVQFSLPLSGLDAPYFQQNKNFIAFNPFLLSGQAQPGKEGYFYPSLIGQKSKLKINLSLPEGQNSGTPGTLSFKSKNGNGMQSHFWDSYAEYSAQDFYLIIGKFEDFDQEELQDNFDFVEIDTRGLRADEIRAKLKPLLTFLEEGQPGDEKAILTDSLKEQTKAGYYFTVHEFWDIDPSQFRLFLSYLQNTKGLGYQKSGKLLEAFAQQRYGEQWLAKLHEKRWNHRDTLARDFQQRALNYRLNNYLAQNPWIASELNEQLVRSHFLDSLLSTFAFPVFEVSYRYVSADEKLYVNFKQDTGLAPPYPIPVKILTAGKADSTIHYGILQDSTGSGRLGIDLKGAPYFVDLTPGKSFPGSYQQKKPDTYHLFALSNAQTEAGREDALLNLFETKNAALFSTTLGIALDDASAEIRLQALKNADKLNASGRSKLEDTIKNLAKSDPDARVEKLAQNLVQKYYAGK